MVKMGNLAKRRTLRTEETEEVYRVKRFLGVVWYALIGEFLGCKKFSYKKWGFR
jgi:hypothetical protein